MIDLHCHILPALDDGPASLAGALEMARALVDDGVTVAACTPHITPGIYHNTGGAIIAAVEQLQSALDDHAIPLFLVSGADNHMVPDFVGALRSGHLLPLHGSRYVLVEPPHRSAPPRLEEFFLDLIAHGYVPILTHPERLSWIQDKYDLVGDLVNAGVWMQLTSGSLTGAFGTSAQYWAERMLDDGLVHILASDAHDTLRRHPALDQSREQAALRLGIEEAENMVFLRPRGILENVAPAELPMPTSIGRSDDPQTSYAASSRDRLFSPSRLRRLFA